MSKKHQQDSGFTVEHDGNLYQLREGLIGLKAPSPGPTPTPKNDAGEPGAYELLERTIDTAPPFPEKVFDVGALKHQVIGRPLCKGNTCKIGGESDQAEDRDTPIKEPVNVDEAAAFSIINRAGKALETLGFSAQITIFKSSKTTRLLLSAHPRHKA